MIHRVCDKTLDASVSIYVFLFGLVFFFTALHSMQDLCSQPGWNLCHLQGKCRFSNHWTTREVPQFMSAKAETLVLWPPYAKSWLIGKDSDAGRDWGQEEKGTTKDEMAGWHHRLDGREFEWTPGDGDGQGGLACGDSWGHKELDTTERLNWTESS